MKELLTAIICKFVFDHYGEHIEDACYNLDALADELANSLDGLIGSAVNCLNETDVDYFFFDEEKRQLTIYALNNDASSICFEEAVIGDDELQRLDYSSDEFVEELFEKSRCSGIYLYEHLEMFLKIIKMLTNHEYSIAISWRETETLNTETNRLRKMLMQFAGVENKKK